MFALTNVSTSELQNQIVIHETKLKSMDVSSKDIYYVKWYFINK